MKKKLIITILIIALFLVLAFVLFSKDNPETEQAETKVEVSIPPEIAADMKVDVSELTSRELDVIENANDIEMKDFILPDFEGETHNLSDYKGQIIILNFWAIGCPPCINELPDFNEVAKKDGVVLVTVAQKGVLGNEKEESYAFIKEFDTVALWDEELETMSIYPSQYYPHTYIIDRSGIVRFVINSASYELLDELVSFCDEKFN